MSLTLYDKALLGKIEKWTNGSNVKVIAPESSRQLFEYLGDTNNDKPIDLPIISIRRQTPTTIINPNFTRMAIEGVMNMIELSEDEQEAEEQLKNIRRRFVLSAIPIRLDYQLDIYTRYYEEAEEYVREFVINLIRYPKIQIEIPYNNSKILVNANIRIESMINDTSDIPERIIQGQFTRKTLSLYIDDAYLWDYKDKQLLNVEGEIVLEGDKK